jgi:undecaprenyl-diphosphatase
MSRQSSLPFRQALSPRLWVMLFAAGACLAIFFATVAWVFEGANVVAPAAAQFDRSISLALAQFRENGGPTGRMTEISAAGSPAVVVIFAVVLGSVILKSRDWLGFAHLVTALLSASVVSRLLQYVWERPRPETLLPYLTVTQHSFPSAHMFGAAACYVTFAFFYARYSGGRATEIVAHVLAALFVVLIGFTRVYLGAHHTTDVIAGTAGGWAWGLLVAVIFSLWYPDPRAPRPRQ